MAVWKKPWRLTEGFIIVLGLIVVGMLLELSIGPVRWSLFAWPVNVIMLAILLTAIAILFLMRRHVYGCRFLMTASAAVPALAVAAVLTVIMGLTRQQVGGRWINDMLTFWPFVLVYTYLVVILGLVVVKRIAMIRKRRKSIAARNADGHRHKAPDGHYVRSQVAFLLNHTGLFVALVSGTLGNADMQRLTMQLSNNAAVANTLYFNLPQSMAPEMAAGVEHEPSLFHTEQRYAWNATMQQWMELPLSVELQRFIMETYDDSLHTPRRYASEIIVRRADAEQRATIDVNKPLSTGGWKIYQKDYAMTPLGADCQVSILELVRDPWLPFVYAGIFMMLAGALLLMFLRTDKPENRKP